MFDFFGLSRQKELSAIVDESIENSKRLEKKVNKLSAILEDGSWIAKMLDSCDKLFWHLLGWRIYSLSQEEINEIRSKSDLISKLNDKYKQTIEYCMLIDTDNRSAVELLQEIRKELEPEVAYSLRLVERLKGQNPLIELIFGSLS